MRPVALPLLTAFLLLLSPRPARAQIIESTGARALGMGGAFVAVATDSSATWWNPGALAAGPWVDGLLSRGVTDAGPDATRRETVSAFSLAAPMLGVSYYRLRVSDIGAAGSTAAGAGDRQDTGASLLGLTLVHSLVQGLHLGGTLKYVHGQGLAAQDRDPDRFDADLGVLVVHRSWRAGLAARNLFEPSFAGSAAAGVAGGTLTLSRQVRAGVAFDGAAVGDLPLTVSLDVDLKPYDTVRGDRQVIAAGVERWLLARRLALRAGGRANTRGGQARAATGGTSVMVRSGMYVDAHGVIGGDDDERGWGIAARFSF